jgi:RES domain-containing protein
LLGGGELVAWRLDRATLAASFDSGEGAYRAGGRWNSKGVRAVYCSIDPATAILEVAVHKGFKALDTVAHVLTSINITETSSVRIVLPANIPNPKIHRSPLSHFKPPGQACALQIDRFDQLRVPKRVRLRLFSYDAGGRSRARSALSPARSRALAVSGDFG